jgi:multicomponent Na+:H+ antiporter subunit F
MFLSILGIVFSIILSFLMILSSKNIYEKLIPLLSISTKISLLIILFSYFYNLPYIFEVGIFYLLLSIGGSFIIASFISRSDI